MVGDALDAAAYPLFSNPCIKTLGTGTMGATATLTLAKPEPHSRVSRCSWKPKHLPAISPIVWDRA
jgi:hypothetical protein